MTRLMIYTVLTGDKEALNNPLQYLSADTTTDLALDFVCFTDSPSLTSPVWRLEPLPRRLMPGNRLSRLPKTRPHLFFPDHQTSLYIDNTVVFKRLPQRADLPSDTPVRAFRHPWRQNPQDEANIVARSGLDAPEVVAGQCAYYDSVTPLRSLPSLTAGTVLLRHHHDPRAVAFGDLWWEQILLFSARDQVSLDLCAQEAGCPIDHFPGDKLTNDFILWPALPTGRRVEASFDAERYAWVNRHDPAARTNPRAHFLTHGGDGAAYERQAPWFAYCCARARSSLGTPPPARGLAPILDPLLHALDLPVSVLIVGATSTSPLSPDPEELQAAEAAFRLAFHYGPPADIQLAQIPAQDLLDPAPYRSAEGRTGFTLIVLLGAPPESVPLLAAKLAPLRAPQGKVVVQTTAPAPITALAALEARLTPNDTLGVHHGSHSTRTEPIPANILTLIPSAEAPA